MGNNTSVEISYNLISNDHWIVPAIEKLPFDVITWNAWSPALPTKEDWTNWAFEKHKISALSLPNEETSNTPSITFLPINFRKKLSAITKVLLNLYHTNQNSYDCSNIPIVFSSRFGEAKATVELLESVGKSELGSPMAFSRSVHNFAVGLNAIATKNNIKNTAISAMQDSFYAGLLEALLQLHGSHFDKILYIFGEDSTHSVFKKFYNIPIPYGISFLLQKPLQGHKGIHHANLFFKDDLSKLNVETESLQFLKNVVQHGY